MDYQYKGFLSYVFDLALHNACLQKKKKVYKDVLASPEISPI